MLLCITASGKFSAESVQDLITDFLMPYAGKDMSNEEDDNTIAVRLASTGVPVYDLARAMYPVPPRVPVAGSESHGEAVSQPNRYDVMGKSAETLSDIPRHLRNMNIDQLRQMECEVHNAIRIKETFTQYRNGMKADRSKPLVIEGDNVTLTLPEVNENDKKRYYKSKRGNLRLARNSKARPGEIEVYLTDEEFESSSG